MYGAGEYEQAIKGKRPTLANVMKACFDAIHGGGLVENGVRHRQTSDVTPVQQEIRYDRQSTIPDSTKNLSTTGSERGRLAKSTTSRRGSLFHQTDNSRLCHRFTTDIRLHRSGDEAFFVGFVMHAVNIQC